MMPLKLLALGLVIVSVCAALPFQLLIISPLPLRLETARLCPRYASKPPLAMLSAGVASQRPA